MNIDKQKNQKKLVGVVESELLVALGASTELRERNREALEWCNWGKGSYSSRTIPMKE